MDRLAGVVRGAEVVARGCSYVAIGLGVANVINAKPGQRLETAAKETGSFFGASAGAAIGYGICTLALGIPTGGTSPLWCAVIVGGGMGVAGSAAGGYLGQESYRGARSVWQRMGSAFRASLAQLGEDGVQFQLAPMAF